MEQKLIPASTVRTICGGVSDMTLWRWLKDPDLAFPAPVYITKRRYWRESDVTAWIEQRSEVK